jgi:cytochrome c
MLSRPLALLLSIGLVSSRQADPTPPETNRFTKVVLAEKLNEPMEMSFLPDGQLLWVERKGLIKRMNPDTRVVTDVGSIAVNTKYTAKNGNKSEAEDGLLGITVDPDFTKNHWLYLYYSPEGTEAKNVIARYELRDNKLVENSRKVLLDIPTQREQCCHTGGGITWDHAGNLYISTGDNTSPRATAFAPIDERAERGPWDAQKSSGNTNDLRGKIIRIHPEADGTYTIPDGNLFPKNTPGVDAGKTRPEIYTMGHRNPWRLSIDSKTGYLYWGEVGPDASTDSTGWGPRGYDEFNQARKAGNFGWPLVIADNKPYGSVDFATGKSRFMIDPAKPINTSPNNTGLTELPPAQKAFIWYPYGVSSEFPLLGSSGRSATGGPVFRQADFAGAKRPFPAYYEGKWFITDFMRGWIMAVSMDEQGNYKSMERFLPGETIGSAIDMKFAPNGDLYLLEYGSAWFRGNDNARIIRFEYNAGNRTPIVQASASKQAGAVPFRTQLSSTGTTDYDRDALKYVWKVAPVNGSKTGPAVRIFNGPSAQVTFDKAGTYRVTLTVTDAKGASNSRSIDLKAGNEPPVVDVVMARGNSTFFFPGKPVTYSSTVSDREDGTLASGKISPAQVAITANYLPDGYDPIEVAQQHRSADASAQYATAQRLIKGSDCLACHQPEKRSLGPGFTEIAQRYKGQQGAVASLAQKVIKGGNGVWGDHSMSAHPQLSEASAAEMVKYILSFTGEKQTEKAAEKLPLAGELTPVVPTGENGKGGYVIRAAYRDRGTKAAPALETEQVIILRNPAIPIVPEQFAAHHAIIFTSSMSNRANLQGDGAYLALNDVDLTGIKSVDVGVLVEAGAAGGTLELRLDSPTGKVVATSSPLQPGKTTKQSVQKLTPEPTTGKHTLYLVGKQAGVTQPLLAINRLIFQPQD